MSNQALNDLIQRFAISALSKERKADAINEEILVGKYSGEFYIKTKDGVVLSADVTNRNKASSNEAIRIAELVGMTGNIYHVDFENTDLPEFIDYEVNLIQQEIVELPVDSKEVLLYLDLDEFIMTDDEPCIIHTEGIVTVIIEIIEDGVKKHIQVDKNLTNINFYRIPLEIKGKVSSIKLINITVGRDENYEMDYTMLIHNLFITVNN